VDTDGNVVTLTMPPRHQPAPLGEFELLVLLATLGLGDAAYPFAIARDLETRTGRKVSRAAVLITLERLEDKELVRSWYGDPTPQRGGRPKRFFQVKARGVQAVRESLGRIETMAAGLDRVLKEKRGS
jgi:DNA-binding PadR family transcriptional regulator